MINKFLTMLGVATALGLSSTTQAQIVGNIGFGGAYTPNGGSPGNLATAMSMTMNSVFIIPGVPPGAFAGAANPTIASPIGTQPPLFTPSLVGNQLWSVMVGPTTYSFIVTSENLAFSDALHVNIDGNGYVSDGVPAHNTSGTWTLQFGVSGPSFTYSETTATSVPEPATLALAGLSGLSLLLFRRQRK